MYADQWAVPSDPRYGEQWYLENTRQVDYLEGIDMQVRAVWEDLASRGLEPGHGVVVAVVDDGVQFSHPELLSNYRPDLSYDFNEWDHDPTPESDQGHGTACSALVMAARDNGVCGIGIAYGAQLAGIRLLGLPVTDSQMASAVGYHYQETAIYSSSWGPGDSADSLQTMGPLLRLALADGVAHGRGGKGSIFVWAAGNGRQVGDNCNYDEYSNNRYKIAVAGVSYDGRQAFYSEPCAAIMVSAPGGGFTYNTDRVVGLMTADLAGAAGKDPGDCISNFIGTSAACPLAAGAIALMLQYNPNLGWRDVQWILARSSTRTDPGDSDWMPNGAGLYVNHKYGYGLINTTAAVQLASRWRNVGPHAVYVSQVKCPKAPMGQRNIRISSVLKVPVENRLLVEHAEVVFAATALYRGALSVTLISPCGTPSVLAEKHADSHEDYVNWKFVSTRLFGEESPGNWTLQVSSASSSPRDGFVGWQLLLHGYCPQSFKPACSKLEAPEYPPVKSTNIHAVCSAQLTPDVDVFVSVELEANLLPKSSGAQTSPRQARLPLLFGAFLGVILAASIV